MLLLNLHHRLGQHHVRDALGDREALARLRNGVVLVHCRGGMNRSATMVAAFLVWKFPGMTAAEAIAVVRQARPAARFGRGEEGVLQRDLRQWELDCAVARESREQDGQGCVD